MPRHQLALPDYYDSGIQGLIALNETQAKGLTSALQAEEPVHYLPDQLAAHIASKVGLERPVLVEIIRALVGLYTARTFIGLPPSEFVEAVTDAVERKELKPADAQAWTSFKENLAGFLKVEGSLAVASKAQSIVTDQDRIFSRARILSDIRPVFKDDPEALPSAVAVIHTLRIHYHRSGDLKSFSVAMDDEDVRKLRDTLDRAQKKSATLRKVAKSADIPVINIEGEPEP
jgi:hypothetical protein